MNGGDELTFWVLLRPSKCDLTEMFVSLACTEKNSFLPFFYDHEMKNELLRISNKLRFFLSVQIVAGITSSKSLKLKYH